MEFNGSEGAGRSIDTGATVALAPLPAEMFGGRDGAETLRQILEAVPAAIYTTDPEGRLTFYNQAAVVLSGRTPVLGSDRWCVSWKMYRTDGTPLPHSECPMAQALKQRRPIRGAEAILERPDGSRLHLMPYPTPLFDSHGGLRGGVNVLVDITERKKGEQALTQLNRLLAQHASKQTQQAADATAELHKSEERFRILVQGVTDYAIFMLSPDGIVTNWNTGAQRIKGYTAEDIVGRHFSTFYTEADRKAGLPQRALRAAASEGRFEHEGWRVRKDGSCFWASVVIDPIRDESGELVGFAKVTRDLTEKRAVEEQLRLSQKLEAIGQLTGGVAHDFNNLLTAIIGNLEMLAAALPAEGTPRRYAETALRAAARGSQLTGQLLAYARRQEIRPEVVNIADLLGDIAILCQKTVSEGVELVVQRPEKVWTCLVDPAQFEAAVLNLASNARDAMNRSGRLIVAVENATLLAADRTGLPAGDYVVLSVADSGCGMSAEVRARAFEPFYTTKEVGKGTGLGLSQVYGFAKQSGGAVWIASQEGVGTTVRLYLPRVDGVPASAGPALAVSRAEPGSATILVVEDDADVRETTVRVLDDLGYRALAAETAEAALSMLRRDRSIDLLLTDVVMPGGVSGVDLARAARKLRPDLKILIASGYGGDTLRGIGGEFAFIAKPHRTAALAAKIGQVLDGRAERPGYAGSAGGGEASISIA